MGYREQAALLNILALQRIKNFMVENPQFVVTYDPVADKIAINDPTESETHYFRVNRYIDSPDDYNAE